MRSRPMSYEYDQDEYQILWCPVGNSGSSTGEKKIVVMKDESITRLTKKMVDNAAIATARNSLTWYGIQQSRA